ncbi:MAG: hypothetical protein HY744_04525 [Deltaproteobacteria bacterium]|nr:hypothetical protein [Deltaproteobacteria bacterium]
MRFLGAAGLAVGVALAACSGDKDETGNGDGAGAGQASSSSSGGGGSSASSSSGSSSSSSSSSGGGGGGPIECAAPYTDVTKGECDLLQQDCPPGSWCDVGSKEGVTTTLCKASSGGLKDTGAECKKTSECTTGLKCLDDHCSPYCCPSNDEPCKGGICDIQVGYPSGNFAMMCSYSQACKLFEGSCPQGQACHVADQDQGLAVCDSPSGQPVEEGGKCKFRNDCGESQLCACKAADDCQCRHFCLVSSWQQKEPGKGGCLPGRTCKSWGQPALPDVGICEPDA